METRPNFLENALFPALQKVGHTAEEDIFTWSQGLGFHYSNLLAALDEKATSAEKDAVVRDLWAFVATVDLGKPNTVLGLNEAARSTPLGA